MTTLQLPRRLKRRLLFLKGYGFGGGAAGLTMDNGEQFGNTEFVS